MRQPGTERISAIPSKQSPNHCLPGAPLATSLFSVLRLQALPLLVSCGFATFAIAQDAAQRRAPAQPEIIVSGSLWLLGSLGGARWSAVLLVSVILLVACGAALLLAVPLEAIALGEAQAAMLGVDVERTKRHAVVVTACAVSAITATTGVIGWIGLIAPHWARMIACPEPRMVLPASGLLGATLVLAADSVRSHHHGANRAATGHPDRMYRFAAVPAHAAAIPVPDMRPMHRCRR